MHVGNLLASSKLFLKRNSSTILTIVGAAGVVATAVTAVWATPKALKLLEDAKRDKGEELTKIETVQVAAPAYVPSLIVGASTIACIFGANILSKRQQGALMSAYALLSSSYNEYKEKVKALHGKEADTEIRKTIVLDHEEERPEVSDEKTLFFDWFSMRYFESTEEDVLKAAQELNELYKERGWVCLNEYYELLDIPCVDFGEELGWSAKAALQSYGYSEIEFEYEYMTVEGDQDNLEACIITMPFEPTEDYIWF